MSKDDSIITELNEETGEWEPVDDQDQVQTVAEQILNEEPDETSKED